MVESPKLDYELLERWINYMAKTTDKYKNKDEWQAMMKKKRWDGGRGEETGRPFPGRTSCEAMLAKNDIDAAEQSHRPTKTFDGTKPKKRTDKPSNFVSTRISIPVRDCWFSRACRRQQNNFWTEIFQREMKDADDPNAMMMEGRQGKPGVLLFRGWGLQSRLGPESQARLKTLQDDLDAAKKKLDPHYPFIHGVKDSDEAGRTSSSPFAAIRRIPVRKCRVTFLSVFSDGDPMPLTQGSGRMQLARVDREATHRHAGDRESHLERTFRHRHCRHAE